MKKLCANCGLPVEDPQNDLCNACGEAATATWEEMSPTEKREDFLVKLEKLIQSFLDENPELFIDGISISSVVTATGDKMLAGLSVDMIVQPTGKGL